MRDPVGERIMNMTYIKDFKIWELMNVLEPVYEGNRGKSIRYMYLICKYVGLCVKQSLIWEVKFITDKISIYVIDFMLCSMYSNVEVTGGFRLNWEIASRYVSLQ